MQMYTAWFLQTGWAWLEITARPAFTVHESSSCQYTTCRHEVYHTSSTLSPASGER